MKKAYWTYQRLKKDTTWQEMWIAQLVEAQAKDRKTMTKQIWHQI